MLAIVKILQYFKWHWVAFLYSSDEYGTDGQKLFIQRIKDTEICLAFTHPLDGTEYQDIFHNIDSQKINVVVVFAPQWSATPLVQSAIRHNVTDKVWIAGEAWSLNKELPKEKGIRNIGTVIGVSQPIVTIPGLDDFIYSVKKQNERESAEQQFCNQLCNCSHVTAEDVLAEDPSYGFSVYSAVYATAHALHNVLNCGVGKCDNGMSIYPHVVSARILFDLTNTVSLIPWTIVCLLQLLAQLKRSNFTLLNERVQFNDNGDPRFGSFTLLFWNQTGGTETFGFVSFYPSDQFFINDSKIQFHSKEVRNEATKIMASIQFQTIYFFFLRCPFPSVPRNVKRDMQNNKRESTNAVSPVKSVPMELMSTEQVGFSLFRRLK